MSWKREEFTSNLHFSSRRKGTSEKKTKNEVHSTPPTSSEQKVDDCIEPPESVSSSSDTRPCHGHRTESIHYGPVSTSRWRPLHPLTHISWSLNERYVRILVYSDSAGHIFFHDSEREVVSQLLIPTSLQSLPSSFDSAISSPHSLEIEECIEQVSPAADSYQCAFRREMVQNDLTPFRSSQPILDLKVTVGNKFAQPVGRGQEILVHNIDLIHAHSITRIGYLGAEIPAAKGWSIPQVIRINTILSLPQNVTIASCEFFPGLPRGPNVEVGPFIFTQHGSSHIYLTRPNSTQPPTILVDARDLKAMIPPTTSDCRINEDSPPLLCLSEIPRHQKDGLPRHQPLLVMFNGFVFRIGFDPIKLIMDRNELDLVIGNSPHHPSTMLAPFFRRNAQEYCLQELNRNIFILDRLEGSVSQFSITGELKQCIEPSPPPGLTYQTPFQDFLVDQVSDVYLMDSFGESIYHWTSNHPSQCHYDLDGYPPNLLKFDRPKPLRPAITFKSTVLQPAIPLVFSTTEGWHPYISPYTPAGVFKRIRREIGRPFWWWWDYLTQEADAWFASDATWKTRARSGMKFFVCCFVIAFLFSYLITVAVMNVTGWGKKQQSASSG